MTYANKDRFSAANVQPPQDTTQYEQVALKLKQANNGQGAVTLSLATAPNPDPLGVTISEWVVSYGGDPVILNDQGSIQAFQYLQKLWKEGVFAKESKQAKYDTEVNYLRGETSWFATNWPFTSPALAQAGLLDKFDVYAGWKGPVRAAHVIGGEVLGMPKGITGKQKDAAIALAQFIMGQQAQTILVSKNAWASVRDDSNGQVPADQKTTFDAVTAALKDGWFRPNVLYWNDVETAESRLTEADVFRRDIEWLSQCDVLVAEALGSSYGVGFEVGYVLGRARHTGQQIVLLYDAGRRGVISRLITGNCDAVCCTTFGYRSLDEGARVSFIVKKGPKGLQAEDVSPA